MLKRLFDISSAAYGLLLVSPLFAVIAFMVKADSPGPVFYRATRIGRNGKPFRIYKFRTMFVGREKVGGDTTAFNDPRITRVGFFLRKYKIDELPQLINVLMGEMSIVGPRPELSVYTDRYTPEERVILSVRPGITDYSSIALRHLDAMVGERDADKVFEDEILPRKNALRMRYVRTCSFGGDMAILARTLAALFTRPRKRGLSDGMHGVR